MDTTTGVFSSRESAAHAVSRLRNSGFQGISLLWPGAPDEQTHKVPTSDTEQPGMGKAVGGLVGAGIGIAGGLELGAIAATAMIPGVGPVVALGLAGAALLGAAGAIGGAAAGSAVEKQMTNGLPADELMVYKDALRKGRSVILVETRDDDEARRVRGILAQNGAESMDAARAEWWIGLRSAEQEHYETLGGDFEQDEQDYRRGFDAALRGTELSAGEREAFRRGYERGQEYRRREH